MCCIFVNVTTQNVIVTMQNCIVSMRNVIVMSTLRFTSYYQGEIKKLPKVNTSALVAVPARLRAATRGVAASQLCD